jgi:hypothetical protein
MQNPVATKRLAAVRVDRRRVGADEQQALRDQKLGAVFGQADVRFSKTAVSPFPIGLFTWSATQDTQLKNILSERLIIPSSDDFFPLSYLRRAEYQLF